MIKPLVLQSVVSAALFACESFFLAKKGVSLGCLVNPKSETASHLERHGS
jgi:hypothetical protein